MYTLRDEIDISITLFAKRGTNIRGLVVELVCERRWSHLAFLNARPASERSTMSSEFIGYMINRVTDVKPLYGDNKSFKPEHGRWVEVDSDDERQQRYVLGTILLGQGTNVVAGPTTLSRKIRLPAEPPPHGKTPSQVNPPPLGRCGVGAKCQSGRGHPGNLAVSESGRIRRPDRVSCVILRFRRIPEFCSGPCATGRHLGRTGL